MDHVKPQKLHKIDRKLQRNCRLENIRQENYAKIGVKVTVYRQQQLTFCVCFDSKAAVKSIS